MLGQQESSHVNLGVDLLLYIGEVTAAYPVLGIAGRSKHTWRISKDGEVRTVFGNTDGVFQMSETFFFKHYTETLSSGEPKTQIRDMYLGICKQLRELVPDDLPFSNAWIAKNMSTQFPKNSIIHFGILNSIRNWDMFPIDGSIHVGDNVRILLVNNGKGTEFRNYNHKGAHFGDAADEYIAAARHYGNKSHKLVKDFAEDLGYEYLSASNKEDFLKAYPAFVSKEINQSKIFEVFTDSKDESDALYIMNHLLKPTAKEEAVKTAKNVVKKVIGEEGVKTIKKIIGK